MRKIETIGMKILYQKDRQNSLLAVINREEQIYKLNVFLEFQNAQYSKMYVKVTDLWHKRFSHIGMKCLEKMQKL